MNLLEAMLPELILVAVACVLLLMGASPRRAARKATPFIALAGLAFVFLYQLGRTGGADAGSAAVVTDFARTFRVYHFAEYIKLLAAGVGILFVLLSWPTNREATGNGALDFATEAGEFFGLMLLSIAGIMLVAGSNDIILLFLGIELASIPTYIMVSISRPIPVAQEAGVKYFFLGALAAAVMLFGFSYLYGTTGLINLDSIGHRFRDTAGGALSATNPGNWMLLAVLMLVAGFAFKLAAVPLHFYAGDVYQGAATPVTALLSFVPKTSGVVALAKISYVAGGNSWAAPETMTRLLWIVAALTMTFGNALGLIQNSNIKRVLAYSSVAHSGYLLVGLTALAAAPTTAAQDSALQGVLFYLAAYGIMNAGAFGVLMLLPARPIRSWNGQLVPTPPTTTAETYDDLAGQGRRHPVLGLAMAVCCFSLIGLPLTIGFFGKLYLIKPALDAKLYWLVVITMANAAVSAGYYLKIVAAMFLRPEPESEHLDSLGHALPGSPAASTPHPTPRLPMPAPIALAVVLSVFGTLLFGAIVPATQLLVTRTVNGAQIEPPTQRGNPTAATASR
jgi:NADH-quinone oxidoreductase subunit N